jgi:two-component system sensor histidine kinase GlrK
LSIGLIYSVYQVEVLAGNMQTVVHSSMDTIEASRQLNIQAERMERSARQYEILLEEDIYQAFLRQYREFEINLNKLLESGLPESIHATLTEVRRDAFMINETLALYPPESSIAAKAFSEFSKIREDLSPLSSKINEFITNKSMIINDQSMQVQKTLVLIALALIPAALLVVVGFGFIISRPLHDLRMAIQRLGNSEFSDPIKISGPNDLQLLGETLEWLRSRLKALEEQKSRFLQQVSHELKTPLTSIREGTELLHDGTVGELSHEQQEIAGILKSSTAELQRQVEGLLRFNEVLAEVGSADKDPVDLHLLIRLLVSEQKLPIRARELIIKSRLHPITINADVEHIRTIAGNLLSNAIKFSPVKGTIRLHLKYRNDQIHFDVIDEGPGISPTDRDRVFEAFFRGKNKPSGYVKGTGLGLAIAQQIASLHQGAITVIDDQDERGAHFRLVLPRTVHERKIAV